MKTYLLNLLKCIISYIPIIGIMLIIMSLPFGYNIFERVGHYTLGIGFVLDYLINKRWQGWYWSRGKLVYVSMLLIFIIMLLWQIWDPTPPTEYFVHILERNLMFLVVGIMGIVGFSDKLRLKYLGYAMLLSCLIIICVNIYFYISTFGFKDFTIERFNHMRVIHINSHMVINLYMNTSLIIGAHLLKKNIPFWTRIVIIISMLFIVGYILLSVGRVGYVTLLLLVFIYTIFSVWKYSKLRWIIVACLSVVVSILLLTHSRLDKNKVLHDPRFAIWDYSIRMSEKHPILGYGLSTLSVEYVEGMYEDDVAYNYFVKPLMAQPVFAVLNKTMETHHPHNAFLMMYLAFGVVGLLALLFLCVAIAIIPSINLKIYIWLFLLALFMQMLFEPLGAHLQPQFIAIVLFCLQRESNYSLSAKNSLKD